MSTAFEEIGFYSRCKRGHITKAMREKLSRRVITVYVETGVGPHIVAPANVLSTYGLQQLMVNNSERIFR